jgi:hypothetical protein
MKIFEMDCYEITESYDRDSSHIAYVSNPTLAQALVDKQKGYRSYHPYKRIIRVFDTMEEIEANSRENLRKSALAKLTASEIEALGLK